MKEWNKKDIGAVGSALTMMIENLIITMMQPMKDMMNELKSDVESIKEWCAEELASMVGKISDMKADIENQINEGINSLGMPTLPQLDVMFTDIEEKVKEIDERVDDLEQYNSDNESSISNLESSLENSMAQGSKMEEIFIDLASTINSHI